MIYANHHDDTDTTYIATGLLAHVRGTASSTTVSRPSILRQLELNKLRCQKSANLPLGHHVAARVADTH
jgi:hypothetical protein